MGNTHKRHAPDVISEVRRPSAVPYPPGIPLLMPGEHAGEPDGPVLGYLRALQHLDRTFPGFGHDIHGVEPVADGTYRILCVKEGVLGG
jgi:arginine decarboxylase